MTQQLTPVPLPGHQPSTVTPPNPSHSLVLTQMPLLTGSKVFSGFVQRPPPMELCGKEGKMGVEAEKRIEGVVTRIKSGWTIGEVNSRYTRLD